MVATCKPYKSTNTQPLFNVHVVYDVSRKACLARAACMPRGLYVLLVLISFFFINKPFSRELRIYWTDCTKFSPYGRYLIVGYRFDPLFPMAQRSLPLQPILGSKMAKLNHSPLFVVAVAFRNGFLYRHFDVNLVNFSPVTPEFKNGKGVKPLVFSLK